MMHPSRFQGCCWIVVAAVLAATCLQADAAQKKKPSKTAAKSGAKKALRWSFKEGDELQYTMVQKMDNTTEVMGQKFSTPVTQSFDMTWQVQELQAGGSATIAQKVNAILFKMEAQFGTMEYDSKAGKKIEGLLASMNAPFDALLESTVTLTASSRGEISNLEIPDALKKALSGGGQGVSEESIKQMAEMGMLPEGPVAVGASWTHQTETKLPMVGTLKIDATYTYKGPEERDGQKLQRIDVALELALEPDPNAQTKATLKSQEGAGEMYFDDKLGRLAEASYKQKMVLEATVQNQKLQQTIDQTSTLKPTERADDQSEEAEDTNKTSSKN